jgi:hypothetical protein
MVRLHPDPLLSYNIFMTDQEPPIDFANADIDPERFQSLMVQEARRNFLLPELPLHEQLGSVAEAIKVLGDENFTGEAVLQAVNKKVNAQVLRSQGALTSATVLADRAWALTVDMLTDNDPSKQPRAQRMYDMLKEPTYGIDRQQLKDMYDAADTLVKARKVASAKSNGNEPAIDGAMKSVIEDKVANGANKALMEAMVKRAIKERKQELGNTEPPKIEL